MCMATRQRTCAKTSIKTTDLTTEQIKAAVNWLNSRLRENQVVHAHDTYENELESIREARILKGIVEDLEHSLKESSPCSKTSGTPTNPAENTTSAHETVWYSPFSCCFRN